MTSEPHENAPASPSSERSRLGKILLLVVVAGAIVRLRQYAARTSFWADESYVVLNIMDHSWAALLNRLEHGQAAPPVFLWLEHAAALAFGPGEYSLRLLPLVCGMVAVGLFAVLARRLFPARIAVCLAILCAFCGKFIAYSVETKQYSGDVMISVALLLLATFPRRGPLWRLRWSACLAAGAVWFSHTSAIVFGAITLVLTLQCWRGERRGLLKAVAANAVFGASFLLLYVTSIRYESTPWMHQGWTNDFPDAAHPARIPLWLLERTLELLGSPFPMIGTLFAVLCILGMVGLAAGGHLELLGLLLLPIALTGLGSVLQRYPYGGSRLSLFMIPQIILLFGAGVQAAGRSFRGRAAWAWWVVPLPAIVVAVGVAMGGFIRPRYKSHVRPAVEYVRSHRQAGDGIYLTGQPGRIDPDPTVGRHLEFLCYWRNPAPPIHTLAPAAWGSVPERRFWVVVPFEPDKPKPWLDTLLADIRRNATQSDRFIDAHGGAAYLFAH